MAETCCSNLVKYFMFFINVVFAIVGIALIGIGAYIQIQAKEYLDFLSDNYLNTPIFIIIVGCVIFVVAFFGCCGAANESACMIYTYSLLITLLLIAQVGAAIAAYALKGELKSEIKDKMESGMSNYGKDGHDGVTNAWNVLQHDLSCCGVNSYKDWNDTIPESCCKVETAGCAKEVENINQSGCFNEFEQKFTGNIAIIGGAALGFGAIQLVGVLFSCYLAKRVRSGHTFA